VIFTAHGWPFTEGRPGWMRWLLARTEAAGARLSTRIICVSEHDRRLAVQFGVATADRMTVIYNGADPMVPDALVPPPGLDAAPRPRTVMVGRLAPAKNPGSLLEAFRALTGGSLIFVGSGPLRPRLEESVRRHGLGGRVLFLGWRDDVVAILRAADIFALPSRWEGLPFAVIEAMMAELPVVATGVGGVPELVDEGRTGLLVPTESPGALAQALRRVAEDPSLRRRMGQAGRARALARFTVERMVRETLEVYRSVLGGEAAGGQDSGLSGRTL
jgi:glycosyltransferase involved in cell wall biosynthesis